MLPMPEGTGFHSAIAISMSAGKRTAMSRRQDIIQALLQDGHITTTELALRFDVSMETIRKDLRYLEDKGIAVKAYGGAVVSSEIAGQTFIQKSRENLAAKARIAQRALSYIRDGDVLILDSGSTISALAGLLGSKKDLTVFTNSIQNVHLLHATSVQLYFTGGKLQASGNAFAGAWGLAALANVHADIAFIGTSGFERLDGPCVESPEESEMKKAMIHAASRSVLLADASKFHKDAVMRFAPWDDFFCLVTDSEADPEACLALQAQIPVEMV